jgi:hypothetical protein
MLGARDRITEQVQSRREQQIEERGGGGTFVVRKKAYDRVLDSAIQGGDSNKSGQVGSSMKSPVVSN